MPLNQSNLIGKDDIFTALLQQGVDILLFHLTGIFTASIVIRYIPFLLREVKAIYSFLKRLKGQVMNLNHTQANKHHVFLC